MTVYFQKKLLALLLLTSLLFGCLTHGDEEAKTLAEKFPAANKSEGKWPLKNSTGNDSLHRFNCSTVNRTAEFDKVVILNGSDFEQLKSLVFDNNSCVILFYYLPYCPYSVAMAPHYNSLPRVFPSLHFLAVDADKVTSLYANYTSAMAPYIRIFHAKDFAGINTQARNVSELANEIKNLTGATQNLQTELKPLPEDFDGPVSSKLKQPTDYWLLLACTYFAALAPYLLSKSQLVRAVWKKLTTARVRQHTD